MSTFTPGPWKLDGTTIFGNEGNTPIATLCKESPSLWKDAALIENALDLLAMLKCAVVDAQQRLNLQERLERAEHYLEVIAKAEGRTDDEESIAREMRKMKANGIGIPKKKDPCEPYCATCGLSGEAAFDCPNACACLCHQS